MSEFTEPTQQQVEGWMAALDAQTEAWAQSVDWRTQLDQLAGMSESFAGRRLDGSGGAALRMLIYRQRNLIDRWVRQAYLEGLMTGTPS